MIVREIMTKPGLELDVFNDAQDTLRWLLADKTDRRAAIIATFVQARIDMEVALRRNLQSQCVGVLYPSIIESEIGKITEPSNVDLSRTEK